jgi:hypothetical protein
MIIRYCRNGHRLSEENIERRKYNGVAVTVRGRGFGRVMPRGGDLLVCPICGDKRFI